MQETAIAKNLTVQENIEFYAKLNGQSREEVDETVRQIYSIFQLDKFAKKQAKKLSGGWQRKLSIALALAKKPKILFLEINSYFAHQLFSFYKIYCCRNL